MNRSRLLMFSIAMAVLVLGLVFAVSVGVLVFRIVSSQAATPPDESPVVAEATEVRMDTAITPVPGDTAQRSLGGAVVPLLDSDSALPDLLVFNQNLTTRAHTLLYLSGDSRTIRWESLPLSDQSRQARVVLDQSTIYLVDQTDLLALNRRDGDLLWEISLSDTIFSNCRDCIRVVGANVVVLTQDGILQSFDSQSGDQVWRERLRDAPRQLLVIGEQVAVMDRLQDGRPEAALQIFDPADGTRIRQIEPTCPDPEGFFSDTYPSIFTPVYDQPADETLYLMFGSISSCAQRLDAASGEVIWRTNVEDLPPAWNDREPLLTDDAIYIGDDEFVIAFDMGSGDLRRVTDEPDYSLQPLAVRDTTLLVTATRTRGSRREELWGIDIASGEPRWRYILQQDADWAWQLIDDGVAIIQKSSTLVSIETLDLVGGTEVNEATITLDDRIRIWRGITIVDNIAYLTLQRLYAIDLSIGEVVYTWP